MKTDTPTLEAVTVEEPAKDRKKQKAAYLKALVRKLTEIAPHFVRNRELKKLKTEAKGLFAKSEVERYEIEEPTRVVIKAVSGSENTLKPNLLKLGKTFFMKEGVTEGEAVIMAQRLFDCAESMTKDDGKPLFNFKDKGGYISIGER